MTKSIITICTIAALITIGLYIWNFTENFKNFDLSENHETWSEFGEFLGGVLSPIFAFGALIAILYTIKIQSEELSLSRNQLEKSAAALEAQNIVLQKQNFEATFFQLLKLYTDIDYTIRYMDRPEETNNVKSFEHLCQGLSLSLSIRNQVDAKIQSKISRLEFLERRYEKFHLETQEFISHYFRTIYNILKFINNSNLPENEKQIYVSLLRAPLTKNKLKLIYYHSLSKYGTKMLPLIIKFNFLKYILDYPNTLLENDNLNLLEEKINKTLKI